MLHIFISINSSFLEWIGYRLLLIWNIHWLFWTNIWKYLNSFWKILLRPIFFYFLIQVKFLQPQSKVSKKMLKELYSLLGKHSNLGILYLLMCEHATYIGLLFQHLSILKLMFNKFGTIFLDYFSMNLTGV